MQINLNDDQLSLVMDILYRAASDFEGIADGLPPEDQLPGYAQTILMQTECRIKAIIMWIENQTDVEWKFDVLTQRYQPWKAEKKDAD